MAVTIEFAEARYVRRPEDGTLLLDEDVTGRVLVRDGAAVLADAADQPLVALRVRLAEDARPAFEGVRLTAGAVAAYAGAVDAWVEANVGVDMAEELAKLRARRLNRVALEAVAEALSGLAGEWRVLPDLVVGQSDTAVRVRRHADEDGTSHLDVGFVLNVSDASMTRTLWDCVTAPGQRPEDVVRNAAGLWARSSAPAFLELVDDRGLFADVYGPESPDGFRGRHAVHGAVAGWGRSPQLETLQAWVTAHPLLPALRPYVEQHLVAGLNGLQYRLGARRGVPAADVRLDGRPLPEASAALLDLGWPRPKDAAYVRSYVLLI